MDKTLIVRKMMEEILNQLKSSNHYPSDADWYIGFDSDQETANESTSEYDPKTGKLVKNNSVGDHTTYLQQWDSTEIGYIEEKDIERDSGVGYQKLSTMFLNPIK